jgi:hypothetical protein
LDEQKPFLKGFPQGIPQQDRLTVEHVFIARRKRQERQALVTVADTKLVEYPEGKTA